MSQMVKNLPEDCGRPELGRSPGDGNSYPHQYSGLENPMDREAWRATAHGVTESQTGWSKFHLYFLKCLSVIPQNVQK